MSSTYSIVIGPIGHYDSIKLNGGTFIMKNKKGQMSTLQSGIIAFIVVAIAAAIGLSVLSEVKSTMSVAAANTSIDQAITGIGKFTTFLPIIALVIVAVVVLGYVYLLQRR